MIKEGVGGGVGECVGVGDGEGEGVGINWGTVVEQDELQNVDVRMLRRVMVYPDESHPHL